jgi:hypothetical protein
LGPLLNSAWKRPRTAFHLAHVAARHVLGEMPQRAAPVRGRGRHARASTAPRWMRVVCPCVDVEVLKHSPLTSHTSLALSSLLSARPRLLLARNDSHGRHQADRPPLLFPSASTSQRFSATTRAPATAAYFPGQPQPRREDLWPRMVNRHGRRQPSSRAAVVPSPPAFLHPNQPRHHVPRTTPHLRSPSHHQLRPRSGPPPEHRPASRLLPWPGRWGPPRAAWSAPADAG